MFFVRSLPAPLHSSFRVLPRVPRNGGPRTGAFFVSGTAFLLSLAPSVGEVASLGTAFGGRGLPRPRTFSLFRPRFPSPTVCPKTVAPVLGDFCEWGGAPCARFSASRRGAALPVRVYAPSTGEVPSPEALFWGEQPPPWAILPFATPLPLSGRVPRGQAAPSRGLFCERSGVPCARLRTFHRGGALARDGLVFGEQSSLPRYSSFRDPSPPLRPCSPRPSGAFTRARRVQQKFNCC